MQILVNVDNLRETALHLKSSERTMRDKSISEIEETLKERVREEFGGLTPEQYEKAVYQCPNLWRGVFAMPIFPDTKCDVGEARLSFAVVLSDFDGDWLPA